jgi:hypothetical protein
VGVLLCANTCRDTLLRSFYTEREHERESDRGGERGVRTGLLDLIWMMSFILTANANAAEYMFARNTVEIASRANFREKPRELISLANQSLRLNVIYVCASSLVETVLLGQATKQKRSFC